jgi:hypothetical protein
MNISLTFLTHNSSSYIIQQLEKNYFEMSKGLVNEIVVLDDCTNDYSLLKKFETDNVKIFRNDEHLYPLLSRPKVVELCKNDWVLLMDSDNFLCESVFDFIREKKLDENYIYAPGFAMPRLDYRPEYGNSVIDLKLASEKLQRTKSKRMDALLNTSNYLVPKNNFLEVAKNIDPKFSPCPHEVVYFNYLWFSSGRKIFCSKDWEYHHTLRPDSFWRTLSGSTGHLLKEIYQMYFDERDKLLDTNTQLDK